ncbi:copper resistance CopC/CopD family protein [Modestobacter marinus]|uniref:copper resistance CopC/CopD family protein n=1 Tax=Modestobacter marinus TaxID=477641 RepID=UPI001C971020|nr:FixH family protein [Modestobacter marinus]
MRRGVPAVLLLVAFLVTGVVTAAPASAHATVISSSPADGERLQEAPAEVVVEFDEPVSLGAGYARVLGAGGERVDAGDADVRDRTVHVPLRDGLPDASYVVTYRVVSADSHPISGAFSFVVGDGELLPADPADTGDATDAGVAAALPAARWLGFLGLTLGLGIPLVLAASWPAGWALPRLRRLVSAGLGAVAAGAVLSFLLQGPYAAGGGLGSVADPQLLGATLDSAYGLTLLARVVLTAALVVLLRARRYGGAPGPAVLGTAAVLGAGLVVSVAAVGHPVAGPLPGLAVPVTAVHVAAMSAWLGGLVVLVAGVLHRATPTGELAAALPRWSRLAGGLIAALVVTGVLQSVREVGSLTALGQTAYGRLLLAKVAVVLVVLVAALVSRDWVQQRLGDGRRPRRRVVAQAFAEGADAEPPDTVDVLRRSVLVELAGAVVVLMVSAALVGTPPARAAVATPVEVTLPLQSASSAEGNGNVQISLDPARVGPTTVTLHLHDDAGTLIQPQQIAAALTEPEQEIGPLELELAPAGPGQYVASPSLPTAGDWTLTVTVRLDEFTAVTARTTFPVR